MESAKLVFNPTLRNTDLHLDVPHWELALEILDSVKAGIQSGTGTIISCQGRDMELTITTLGLL